MESIETYALAGIGVIGGVYKYFIKEPIVSRVSEFFESRLPNQEELDQLIGELALRMFDGEETND